MRLILPSAKIVPEELQKLGKLPAIIYPINESIVFDYLYKQYESVCDGIDIIAFEKIDKIQRRLSKYKKNNKAVIKELPKLEDLGFTVWYALKDITEPVIINFADTIVLDNIFTCDADSFFFTEDHVSEQWTYYREENGVLTDIIDKSKVDSTKKQKLFVGVFQIKEPQIFVRCLEKAAINKPDNISSFYYALQLYSTEHPFIPLKTNNWFDIGHADKYYSSNLEVKAREFNHITIDKDRSTLRKSSDDKDKFIGEIKWYLKLPADIEYVRPRIFSYSTAYSDPYVCMEYYSYHTVHELFLYGDLNRNQWIDIFKRIKFVCHDFSRYQLHDPDIQVALKDMYLDKTIQRFDKLKADTRFVKFFINPVRINGKRYCSLAKVLDVIHELVPQLLLDVEAFNIIHGDLCFANILVDNNFSFIKVIDPRGKFGKYDIYGDFRYELAKLFHSV
ncbi:TPA: capsular biosynthesis protein, partial [Enterococcus faecium]